jgi:peroxiredoxin
LRLPRTAVAAACGLLITATPPVPPPTIPDQPTPPAAIAPLGSEPSPTLVEPGDPAPAVSWEGPVSRTQRLRDLTAQGNVLLVFAPTLAQLQALERDRDPLLNLRVVPAAVLERNAAGAAALARRLDLHFTLIPDPRHVIAAQFNAVDATTLRTTPAWFVLDRRGNVRALDRSGVPTGGFARLASAALNLPVPGTALPGSTR